MTTVLDTGDLDVVRETLAEVYGGLRLTVVGDGCRARLTRERLGGAELQRSTFGMRFSGHGQPLGTLGFARVHGGVIAHRRGRRLDVYTAGDVFLIAQPDEDYHVGVENPDVEGAFLDPGLFAEVNDGLPVLFTGYRPVSAHAAALWSRAHSYFRDVVLRGPATVEPLLAGPAVRMLAATALAVFPNTGEREPTARDRRDAHPAGLRRALAFIDGNAHLDLSDAALATAARVSVRSLRLAFERHLGVTPAAHLRRVRGEMA